MISEETKKSLIRCLEILIKWCPDDPVCVKYGLSCSIMNLRREAEKALVEVKRLGLK